jgi:hypothetical protein
MHVLAFILYQELKRADFSRWTSYEDFLLNLFAQGRLIPGQLQRTFTSYGDAGARSGALAMGHHDNSVACALSVSGHV